MAQISAPDSADKIRAAIDAVVEDFNQQRYDAAQSKLQELSQSMPADPTVMNLLGSVYSKKKNYIEAETYYRQALDQEPDFFPAAFNLGELLFLQEKYSEARNYFQKLRFRDRSNELLQFKVALCDIKAGDEERAHKSMNSIAFPGDSPAWYYARAAWEYHHGNSKKGREYVHVAQSLFGTKSELFDKTFAELGYK